jgi:Ni,Fe-hydrogenase III component G
LDSQPAPADAVTVFAPWCGEAERALRIRIHRARDSATARGTRSRHGDARTIYWIAAQIASAWVFARASEDSLKETIGNLASLFLVAGWIERTEAADVE